MAVMALAGCGTSTARTTPTPTPATTTAPSPGSHLTVAGVAVNYYGTADVTHTHKLTVTMQNNYFQPTVIRGAPGEHLVLTVQNQGKNPHTFTTADWQVDMEVQPNMIGEAKVTLPQSGNLSFFCRYSKDRGMAGGFTVSGPMAQPGPTLQTR
jgi:plastocyanin